MVAVNKGHLSVVDALLKGGADVNIKQKVSRYQHVNSR